MQRLKAPCNLAFCKTGWTLLALGWIHSEHSKCLRCPKSPAIGVIASCERSGESRTSIGSLSLAGEGRRTEVIATTRRRIAVDALCWHFLLVCMAMDLWNSSDLRSENHFGDWKSNHEPDLAPSCGHRLATHGGLMFGRAAGALSNSSIAVTTLCSGKLFRLAGLLCAEIRRCQGLPLHVALCYFWVSSLLSSRRRC